MEKYQIIPRKFRPKSFYEVLGQGPIVQTLKNSLQKNRIGQAYLFCGTRGCGKTTLARVFAKALNCSGLSPDCEPCNSCRSCIEISDGRSLDIFEIDGASNRGIEDIRKLNETVHYVPRGLYKIYIIDEVHMLTKEAFNALLKTLEEPPSQVKFFFATTEAHKIPATIVSRCQKFQLQRISQAAIIQKLQGVASSLNLEIEEQALMQISYLAEGSLRDAESLLDQLICFGKTPITFALAREVFGLVSYEILLELDEAIHTKNEEQAIRVADLLYESGKDISTIIECLLEHFTTYLSSHLGKPLPLFYQKWGAHYKKEFCLTLLEILVSWQKNLLRLSLKKVHLSLLFVNLVQAPYKIPFASLVQRLMDLEKRLQTEEGASPPVEEKPLFLEKKKETPFVPIPPSPVQELPKNKEEPLQKKPQEINQTPLLETMDLHAFETLIRFAAVELEGSINRS